jgi:hypothetical protein
VETVLYLSIFIRMCPEWMSKTLQTEDHYTKRSNNKKTRLSIFGDLAICGTTERSECTPSSASPRVQLRQYRAHMCNLLVERGRKRESTFGTWDYVSQPGRKAPNYFLHSYPVPRRKRI